MKKRERGAGVARANRFSPPNASASAGHACARPPAALPITDRQRHGQGNHCHAPFPAHGPRCHSGALGSSKIPVSVVGRRFPRLQPSTHALVAPPLWTATSSASRGTAREAMPSGSCWIQPRWQEGEAESRTSGGMRSSVAASAHVLRWATDRCNAEGSELWNCSAGQWGIYSYLDEVFQRAMRTGAVRAMVGAGDDPAAPPGAREWAFEPEPGWPRARAEPDDGRSDVSSRAAAGCGGVRALVFATSVLNEAGLPLFALVLPTEVILAPHQRGAKARLSAWTLCLLLAADELASPPPIALTAPPPPGGTASDVTLADVLAPLRASQLPYPVKFHSSLCELVFDSAAPVHISWSELPTTANSSPPASKASTPGTGGSGPAADQPGGTAAALKELLPLSVRALSDEALREWLTSGAHWSVARSRVDPRSAVSAWSPERRRMEVMLPLPVLRAGPRSHVAQVARAVSRVDENPPCREAGSGAGSAGGAAPVAKGIHGLESDASTPVVDLADDTDPPAPAHSSLAALTGVREQYETAEEESVLPPITLAAVAVWRPEPACGAADAGAAGCGWYDVVGVLPLHEAHRNARMLGPVCAAWLKGVAAFPGGAVSAFLPFGCAETLPSSLKPLITALMGSRSGRGGAGGGAQHDGGASVVTHASGGYGDDSVSVAGSDDTSRTGSGRPRGARRSKRRNRGRVARAPSLSSGLAGVVGIESHAPPSQSRVLPPVAGEPPVLPLRSVLPILLGPQRGSKRAAERSPKAPTPHETTRRSVIDSRGGSESGRSPLSVGSRSLPPAPGTPPDARRHPSSASPAHWPGVERSPAGQRMNAKSAPFVPDGSEGAASPASAHAGSMGMGSPMMPMRHVPGAHHGGAAARGPFPDRSHAMSGSLSPGQFGGARSGPGARLPPTHPGMARSSPPLPHGRLLPAVPPPVPSRSAEFGSGGGGLSARHAAGVAMPGASPGHRSPAGPARESSATVGASASRRRVVVTRAGVVTSSALRLVIAADDARAASLRVNGASDAARFTTLAGTGTTGCTGLVASPLRSQETRRLFREAFYPAGSPAVLVQTADGSATGVIVPLGEVQTSLAASRVRGSGGAHAASLLLSPAELAALGESMPPGTVLELTPVSGELLDAAGRPVRVVAAGALATGPCGAPVDSVVAVAWPGPSSASRRLAPSPLAASGRPLHQAAPTSHEWTVRGAGDDAALPAELQAFALPDHQDRGGRPAWVSPVAAAPREVDPYPVAGAHAHGAGDPAMQPAGTGPAAGATMGGRSLERIQSAGQRAMRRGMDLSKLPIQ